MQRLIEVKRRIKTVANIQNITRTLATVASAKLSRTRARAAGLRVYSGAMRDMLRRQQRSAAARGVAVADMVPLLSSPTKVEKVTLLHIAADRGMCGNYNIAANRLSLRFAMAQRDRGAAVELIVKGQKGERFFSRKTDLPIVHFEPWSRAGVKPDDVDRFHDMVVDRFLSGETDEVYCTYTQFFSPVRREPRVVRLLPLTPETVEPAGEPGPDGFERWAYEPGPEAIIADLMSEFLRVQIEDVLLESYAAEQGARMITMEEATERADKALHECRVLHNRLRREVITTDLLGIMFASKVREAQQETGGAT